MDKKSIIVFDGICSLCNKFVLFVVKRDYNDHFRFISLQNPNLKKYVNSSNKIDTSKADSILLINHEGNVKIKSEAIALIFCRLKGLKALTFIINLFPNKIRNLVYSLIAKHRYKIFGKTNQCSLIEQKLHKNLYEKKVLL
mgnify:CR=1 FL=1|tara:strand:- start:338 stop:760 length:423 start_codon:yes stop_codon:yes gene_type:complete